MLNTLRPRPNRRHFADDIFKCIFENENEWLSHRLSLKFVPKVRINNIPALVQIMAWRWPGDKPLSEPMMLSLLTHICVTRPQWVLMSVHDTWIHVYCEHNPIREGSDEIEQSILNVQGQWLWNCTVSLKWNYQIYCLILQYHVGIAGKPREVMVLTLSSLLAPKVVVMIINPRLLEWR